MRFILLITCLLRRPAVASTNQRTTLEVIGRRGLNLKSKKSGNR